MKTTAWILIFVLGMTQLTLSQPAQTPDTPLKTSKLNIFLDCKDCDIDYIKNNLKIVNYVETHQSADVYVQITSIGTGDGGKEHKISCFGQGKFSSTNVNIPLVLPAEVTKDAERETILKNMRIGLGSFLVQTPYKSCLDLVCFDLDGLGFSEGIDLEEESDPFRNWKFEIGGTGSLNQDEYSKGYMITSMLNISKLNDNIKMLSKNTLSLLEDWMKTTINDSTYVDYDFIRLVTSNNLFVKSLGTRDRCGIGGIASFEINSNNYIERQISFGPAFEYNIFPYDLASDKYFIVRYNLLYEMNNYDTTLISGLKRDMFSHGLLLHYYYIHKGTEIDANVSACNYLDDTRMFSVGAYIGVTITPDKLQGFSIQVGLGASFSQNPVSVEEYPEDPKGHVMPDSGLSYSSMFTLTYRFGSKNNSYVNPRFEF